MRSNDKGAGHGALVFEDGFDMLDMEIVLGNLTEQDVMDVLGSIDLVEEWKICGL